MAYNERELLARLIQCEAGGEGENGMKAVAGLQAAGCNALGLSGADGNAVTARRRSPQPVDYGIVETEE